MNFSDAQLREFLTEIVKTRPGLDKHQILRVLIDFKGPRLTLTELNRVLYAIPVLEYRSDSGNQRYWYLRSAATATASGTSLPPPRELSAALKNLRPWQWRALLAWRGNNFSGVVEAVTGAGKTRVGLAAADLILGQGGQTVVVVPSIELQKQWHKEIHTHLGPGHPGLRVGLLGGESVAIDFRSNLLHCDLLIAVAASGTTWPYCLEEGRFGLLIADECHGYGAPKRQYALEPDFALRLGLTATYEREDSGIEDILDPYFGGVVYSLDYEEALSDGVIADFKIAFIGVPFTAPERKAYVDLSEQLNRHRTTLVREFGIAPEPFGTFMREVTKLKASGERIAGFYLSTFTKRRQLLSSTRAKMSAVRALAPATRRADKTIMFAQDRTAAREAAAEMQAAGVHAAALDSSMSLEHRNSVMVDFEDGTHDLVVAPRLLDEGINIPAADLAIVLATSRSRRQLVQRMGRVLRVKTDGRPARLAVLYVKGTSEDPIAGAHEDFIARVLPAALDVSYFDAGRELAEACNYLCTW